MKIFEPYFIQVFMGWR